MFAIWSSLLTKVDGISGNTAATPLYVLDLNNPARDPVEINFNEFMRTVRFRQIVRSCCTTCLPANGWCSNT